MIQRIVKEERRRDREEIRVVAQCLYASRPARSQGEGRGRGQSGGGGGDSSKRQDQGEEGGGPAVSANPARRSSRVGASTTALTAWRGSSSIRRTRIVWVMRSAPCAQRASTRRKRGRWSASSARASARTPLAPSRRRRAKAQRHARMARSARHSPIAWKMGARSARPASTTMSRSLLAPCAAAAPRDSTRI